LQINHYGCSLAGRSNGIDKEHNQDMNLEIDGFIDKETKLFVVADGHGFNGHYVSAVIKQRLPELILQNISSPETIF